MVHGKFHRIHNIFTARFTASSRFSRGIQELHGSESLVRRSEMFPKLARAQNDGYFPSAIVCLGLGSRDISRFSRKVLRIHGSGSRFGSRFHGKSHNFTVRVHGSVRGSREIPQLHGSDSRFGSRFTGNPVISRFGVLQNFTDICPACTSLGRGGIPELLPV